MKITTVIAVTSAIVLVLAGAAHAQSGVGSVNQGLSVGQPAANPGQSAASSGLSATSSSRPATGAGQSPASSGRPAANSGHPTNGSKRPTVSSSHPTTKAVHAVVGAPTKQPWDDFKLNPKTRMTLDFRNADVDAILHYFSMESKVTIVKNPSLTGVLTLQSPEPQSLDTAFHILNEVLGLHTPPFAIVKVEDLLMVTVKAPPPPPAPPAAPAPPPAPNKPVLHIYVLKYANAATLVTTINQLFAPSPSAPGSPGGPPGMPPGMPGGPGGPPGQQNATQVHASADEYSNSLIVSAPQEQQDEIVQIVNQIDKATDVEETSKVFHLKHALAESLEPVIENVLSGSVSLGRSASTATTAQQRANNRGNGGMFYVFGPAPNTPSNNNGNGTVVADTITNSLIVTTTPDLIEHVTKVIQELDVAGPHDGTTFVYVMKYARAEVVANLLNQAFGNHTTGGATGGSLTNPTFNNGSLGLNPAPANTNNSPYGYFGGFQVSTSGNNSIINQGGDSQGLGPLGDFVNIQNLTGQVILVPNIDANSIIVVTQPEYRDTVKAILQQMDTIPAQVMIQTLVVETNLDQTDSLGVEWNFNIPGLGHHGTFSGTQNYGTVSTPGTTTSTNISTQNTGLGLPEGGQVELTAGGYQAVVDAIQQDSKYKVLSTPRVFTTNNATAQINISQQIPYVTNSTYDTTTGATTATTS